GSGEAQRRSSEPLPDGRLDRRDALRLEEGSGGDPEHDTDAEFTRRTSVRRSAQSIALFILMLTASNGIAGAPAWTSSPVSGPIAGAPIREYGIVDQGILSRSGRPTTEGYGWLGERGVRAVVNLTEQDIDATVRTQSTFSSYLWLPMHLTPTEEQAEQFLDFVQDPRHWPVHVH